LALDGNGHESTADPMIPDELKQIKFPKCDLPLENTECFYDRHPELGKEK